MFVSQLGFHGSQRQSTLFPMIQAAKSYYYPQLISVSSFPFTFETQTIQIPIDNDAVTLSRDNPKSALIIL